MICQPISRVASGSTISSRPLTSRPRSLRRACALLALALLAGGVHAQLVTYPLNYSSSPPVLNPFKGFMDYSPGELPGSANFPHSLEFFYIGMDEFYENPAVSLEFDFSALEVELEDIKSRGRQAVFRVFIDYPEPVAGGGCPSYPTMAASKAAAAASASFTMPAFLFPPLVSLTNYCDGSDFGWSPDYTDSDLLDEIVALIGALNTNYDNDARIAAIEVGFMGHWGEWHTYLQSQDLIAPSDPLACGVAQTAAHAAMNQVLNAFGGFASTRTVVSADVLQCALDFTGTSAGVDLAFYSIGIHDDDFANATACESFGYAARSESLGFDQDWQSLAIGGEVQPALQDNIHADDDGSPTNPCETPITQRDSGELDEAVSRVHSSWLLDYNLFHDPSPSSPLMQVVNAEASARTMGYQLYVSRVDLPPTVAVGSPLNLAVRIENLGVAPLSYDLPVELVVLAGAVEVASLTLEDVFLMDVIDATPIDFVVSIANHGLPPGAYDLALRVPNPMSGGLALRFANQNQVGDLLLLPPVLEVLANSIFDDGFESGSTSAWN